MIGSSHAPGSSPSVLRKSTLSRVSDARSWLDASSHREQGEFVVILHPIAHASQPQDGEIDFSAVDPWVDALLETMSVRDVAKLVANVTGLSKDVVYTRALTRSGK